MYPLQCKDKTEFDERCNALVDPKGLIKIEKTPRGYIPCVAEYSFFSRSKQITNDVASLVVNFFEANEKFLSGTSKLVYQLKDRSECDNVLNERFYQLFAKSVEMDLLHKVSIEEEKILQEVNLKAGKILEAAKETSEKAACMIQQATANAALIEKAAKDTKEKLLVEIAALEKRKEEKSDTLFTCGDGLVFASFKALTEVSLFTDYLKFPGKGVTEKQKEAFPHILHAYNFKCTKQAMNLLLGYLEQKQALEKAHPKERKECIEGKACEQRFENLDSNTLLELYYLAREMGIESIEKYCTKVFEERLLEAEWLSLLGMADVVNSSLIQAALENVAHNFSELSTEAAFLTIQKEFLIEL